jgi:hypothetical protein
MGMGRKERGKRIVGEQKEIGMGGEAGEQV